MRVLLLGANGFIGGYLLADLRRRGHDVVAAVRNPRRLAGARPPESVAIDLNRDVHADAWLPRLSGIDAVVNCAGVLQGTRRDRIDAVHSAAPRALFEACVRAGVKRVVQVSAVSAVPEAGTEYARTKRQADDALRASALSWTVIRPSLVYAPGAFGGTALFRAMAALPFRIPLPGDGSQKFQPIHVEDVCAVVARALETDALAGKTLDAVGPREVTLRELLADLRRWMGFGEARFVRVPIALVKLAARAGDLLGGPANSTAIRQLEFGNTSDAAAYRRESGLEPAGWPEGLDRQPSQWQDRWHARLHFLRPFLRLAIGLLWLASATAGVFVLGLGATFLAISTGLSEATAFAILAAACAADFAIGLLVLARWRPGVLAMVQVGFVAAYTLAATFLLPDLWSDPFGSLLKNFVIVPAVLALAALEQDR